MESACKLITCSKQIVLNENGAMDKNRIYLSGTSIMSTKLTVSLAMRNKYCDQLAEAEVSTSKIRRCNFLEKQQRANCYSKMKNVLSAVAEL